MKIPHGAPASSFIDFVNYNYKEESTRNRLLNAEILLRLEGLESYQTLYEIIFMTEEWFVLSRDQILPYENAVCNVLEAYKPGFDRKKFLEGLNNYKKDIEYLRIDHVQGDVQDQQRQDAKEMEKYGTN